MSADRTTAPEGGEAAGARHWLTGDPITMVERRQTTPKAVLFLEDARIQIEAARVSLDNGLVATALAELSGATLMLDAADQEVRALARPADRQGDAMAYEDDVTPEGVATVRARVDALRPKRVIVSTPPAAVGLGDQIRKELEPAFARIDAAATLSIQQGAGGAPSGLVDAVRVAFDNRITVMIEDDGYKKPKVVIPFRTGQEAEAAMDALEAFLVSAATLSGPQGAPERRDEDGFICEWDGGISPESDSFTISWDNGARWMIVQRNGQIVVGQSPANAGSVPAVKTSWAVLRSAGQQDGAVPAGELRPGLEEAAKVAQARALEIRERRRKTPADFGPHSHEYLLVCAEQKVAEGIRDELRARLAEQPAPAGTGDARFVRQCGVCLTPERCSAIRRCAALDGASGQEPTP